MTSSDLPDKGKPPGFDLRKADASYKAFPSFSEWASKCVVDTRRWERYSESLEYLRRSSPSLLPRALEIVKRAAGFDTGAIEGLYETDRGFTLTVATEVAYWEAKVEEKGPKVRALFESQLKAYDLVLDLATQNVPIAEAWIRKLHEEICGSQDTYEVWTEIGPQVQPLPKGEYKHLPNHVRKADGSIHSYASVDMTPPEMYRFCEELRSDAFLAAHPILQASYSHYGFVVVHPFADGNGRVARALASVFTYRSQSVPLLVLVDNRKEYYSSLEAADGGDFQPFVDFILERALDAVRLAELSLRAATAPRLENGLTALKQLYLTKGGYTQQQVDEVGDSFFNLFLQELNRKGQEASVAGVVGFGCNTHGGFQNPAKEGYRPPVTRAARALVITFRSEQPLHTSVSRSFQLEVPKDCGDDDDLVIRGLNSNELLEARIAELMPAPTAALQMRLTIWIDKILGDAVDELSRMAASLLKSQG